MKSQHPEKNVTERGMEHSAQGKMDNVKGKLKDAAGGLTGDAKLQAEGKMDQVKGKTKDTIGKIERKIGEHESRRE